MIPTRGDSSLGQDRRRRELDALWSGERVDVLVVGGGITGAGVALDAASRGLRVALVEKHDLAFGTSRWSSKLVHGGLRYLASGQFAVAHESAVERGILMTRTAPHLVRSLPQIVPLHASVSAVDEAIVRVGLSMGDVLRSVAGTASTVLPGSRRIGPAEVADFAPTVLRQGLRGGARSWDGQLVDDARLVVAVARTAALYGASILTGVSAHDVDRTSALLRDERTGEQTRVRAGVVVNAAGVWAGEVDPRISLRPSRGTHLVFDASLFAVPQFAVPQFAGPQFAGSVSGGLRCSLTVPVPGERNRFVFALPAPLGRVYVGLTDEVADFPIPDVPTATESEIDFLLDVLSTAVDPKPTRADVLGTFAGLRPLLDAGSGPTADVSRRHAILDDGDGPVGVVGGKLTTYRSMAEHAVDAAVAATGVAAGPCRTASTPLVGAATPSVLAGVDAPIRWVRRYGTESALVRALADEIPGGYDPIAGDIDVTEAELAFAVRYEGANTVADLLDRRTRIGLVAADRERAIGVAERVLERYSRP